MGEGLQRARRAASVETIIAGFRRGLGQLRIPEVDVKVTWITEPVGGDGIYARFRCRVRDGGIVEHTVRAADLRKPPHDHVAALLALFVWFRRCVQKVCEGGRKLPEACGDVSVADLHRVAFGGHFALGYEVPAAAPTTEPAAAPTTEPAQ